MKLFFYRLKGSRLSLMLLVLMAVIGLFTSTIMYDISPTVGILVGISFTITCAFLLLLFCHFKNQEKIAQDTDEMLTVLKRINSKVKISKDSSTDLSAT